MKRRITQRSVLIKSICEDASSVVLRNSNRGSVDVILGSATVDLHGPTDGEMETSSILTVTGRTPSLNRRSPIGMVKIGPSTLLNQPAALLLGPP